MAPSLAARAQNTQAADSAPANKSVPASKSAPAVKSATPNKHAAGEAAASSVSPNPDANRAVAYYHAALASVYEDDAISDGQPGDVTQAIEQYKTALDADPDSASLQDELADLYFRSGRVQDAEATAKDVLKTSPDDADAHKLLGRIYLRQLGEAGSGVSSPASSSSALDKAIAEFAALVRIEPRSVEDRMVLGQLYTVAHDQKKAEAEFQSALAIEPDSEDAVLNLARVYAESGDTQNAIQVIEAVPEGSRTPKMDFTLGALYDQLKKPADAIAAYKQAANLEPDNLQTVDALAQALLKDNQLDAALKQYQNLAQADPENSDALVRIAEIERRQGRYQDALTTIQKARKIDPNSLEAGYNEGLLLDILGRLDEAAQTYQGMVEQIYHANGAYTADEKNNRGIFLDRLGGIYVEQDKTPQALAAYQKMIDLGGDDAISGYQGQVAAYSNDHELQKAIAVSRKAVAAFPKSRDLKLMLAGELADSGQADQGLAMARSLLNNSSDDRDVYLQIARMDIRLFRWKDAKQALDKAEPLSTRKDDRVLLLFMRGEWAERQKHDDQAARFFKQALDLDPDSAMTLNYLGYMWADRGEKLPEALKMIQKAVRSDPSNPAYLDSLGWVYYKMGDYDLAEDNLRSAVARDGTDPTVHMHLGDLYQKTGRIRLAAAQWQLSLAEFSKSLRPDIEPCNVVKVRKDLESARIKLAKEDRALGQAKSSE